MPATRPVPGRRSAARRAGDCLSRAGRRAGRAGRARAARAAGAQAPRLRAQEVQDGLAEVGQQVAAAVGTYAEAQADGRAQLLVLAERVNALQARAAAPATAREGHRLAPAAGRDTSVPGRRAGTCPRPAAGMCAVTGPAVVCGPASQPAAAGAAGLQTEPLQSGSLMQRRPRDGAARGAGGGGRAARGGRGAGADPGGRAGGAALQRADARRARRRPRGDGGAPMFVSPPRPTRAYALTLPSMLAPDSLSGRYVGCRRPGQRRAGSFRAVPKTRAKRCNRRAQHARLLARAEV